jgi:hypothetical protein
LYPFKVFAGQFSGDDPGGTSFAFSGIVCKCAIKSLRNSSSVKDSIGVLIVMIERKFPLYFLSFLPAPL